MVFSPPMPHLPALRQVRLRDAMRQGLGRRRVTGCTRSREGISPIPFLFVPGPGQLLPLPRKFPVGGRDVHSETPHDLPGLRMHHGDIGRRRGAEDL